ncbi:MAG: hypothetical protein ACKOCM_12175 [Cyanobacteriota bacterium]
MPWTRLGPALVLVAGSLLVISHPRPRALGLARLLLASDLLQSFPIDPSQPVPDLWRQRLGARAGSLWTHASGSWWQLWSRHDDGGAYLVLPITGLPREPWPATAVPVDDLLVIAPDRLAAEELKQPLRLAHRQLQGLEQRCLERLQQDQAVYWSSQGLAGILGPLTPLMQHWQQGCLSLQLGPDRLGWEGESSAVPSLSGSRPAPRPVEQRQPETSTLPDGTLLTIRGQRLDLLVGGLLRRALVRDSLADHYGLDQGSLSLLAGSPFALSLRSLPTGPFRLGLTLELGLKGQQPFWIQVLDRVERGIREQGLVAAGPTTTPEAGRSGPSGPASDRSWNRPDGAVVGGWRWLPPGRAGRGRDQRFSRLLLFIGPAPANRADQRASTAGLLDGSAAAESLPMQLLMRPRQLAAERVLPGSLPPLVQDAERLDFTSGHQKAGQRAGEISPLWGELFLRMPP